MSDTTVTRDEDPGTFKLLEENLARMDTRYAGCQVLRIAVDCKLRDGFTVEPPEGHVFVILALGSGENRKAIMLTAPEMLLNAPTAEQSDFRVKQVHIDDAIKDCRYIVAPSGKQVICELTMHNGFVVSGVASLIDPQNFNLAKGADVAYGKAKDRIAQVLAYGVQERLHDDREGKGIRVG